MKTTEIIRLKVDEQIDDNHSGFSDVWNGKRVTTYTHYHLNIITVNVGELPQAGFDKSDRDGIYDYIISNI